MKNDTFTLTLSNNHLLPAKDIQTSVSKFYTKAVKMVNLSKDVTQYDVNQQGFALTVHA